MKRSGADLDAAVEKPNLHGIAATEIGRRQSDLKIRVCVKDNKLPTTVEDIRKLLLVAVGSEAAGYPNEQCILTCEGPDLDRH